MITIVPGSFFHELVEDSSNCNAKLRLYVLASILRDHGVVPRQPKYEISIKYNVISKSYEIGYAY